MGVVDHHMLVPEVPAEMEAKRDLAIAAIAIQRRCTLRDAAAALVKVTAAADSAVQEALRR